MKWRVKDASGVKYAGRVFFPCSEVALRNALLCEAALWHRRSGALLGDLELTQSLCLLDLCEQFVGELTLDDQPLQGSGRFRDTRQMVCFSHCCK
jgi:hypothetical protein